MPRNRLGIYLFIIGLMLLLYFFASDQSKNPQFLLFFFGLLLVILGIFLGWRYRPAPQPSGRFRLIRKIGALLKKKKT
jgi:uncharacterized membrane protein HdeD (DUF308 family)